VISKLRGTRAQATLEIAVVGVLFAAIVIGLVEVGRAVWNYNTLAQATREGVRYAIVHGSRSAEPSGPGSANYTAPDQDAGVTEVVRRHASGLDAGRVEVSAVWLDGTNGRGARVKVTARYSFESAVGGLLGLPGITLTSSSLMRITY
jgi:Flp pilus assembly protein TadG